MLKTIFERVELRPNGLRMILSLVPLTPAAAPPNRLHGFVFTREFPLRIKCGGVEMRFAINAPDPRACPWPEQGRPIPIRCPARREDAALRHARELLTLDPANAQLGELGSDLEKKAR